MRINLIAFFILFFTITTVSAQNPKSDKELLDSLIKSDPMLKALDSVTGGDHSYATFSIGIGNKLFSVKNNRLNTLQNDSKLVLSPSLSYFHKSGFGLNATANMLNDNSKLAFYQYSLTPSFDISGKNIEAGIAYTRYFIRDKYSTITSPVQNDFNGYLDYKKGNINPSVSVGYANGNLNEIVRIDTLIPAPGPGRIKINDTIKTRLNSFSFSAGVSHTFNAYGVFSDNDGFSFIPQVLLNFGADKYVTSHSSSTIILDPRRPNRINRHFEQTSNSGLQAQSVALSLYSLYSIKSFFVKPYFYLDYYLPSSTENWFSTVLNISIGYSF